MDGRSVFSGGIPGRKLQTALNAATPPVDVRQGNRREVQRFPSWNEGKPMSDMLINRAERAREAAYFAPRVGITKEEALEILKMGAE